MVGKPLNLSGSQSLSSVSGKNCVRCPPRSLPPNITLHVVFSSWSPALVLLKSASLTLAEEESGLSQYSSFQKLTVAADVSVVPLVTSKAAVKLMIVQIKSC